MEAGGDGPSLTFAQTEALLDQNNVVIAGPHQRYGKYCFNAKKTSAKGDKTRQLWSKPHDRLTRGAETPGSEAWMGFARSVCSEWSFKPKRKRKASELPRSSKRVKAAESDGRAQNGGSYRKLRALLKAPARDSIRHKRIIAALLQALQHPIKLRSGLETRKTASRCGEQFSGPSGSTNAWRRTDNVANWALYSLRLSEVVRSRRLVSLLRPYDEQSPTGGETHQEEPEMNGLQAAVLSIVLAAPSGDAASTATSLRTACFIIRLYPLILRC
jgi:hypothetical protein